MARLYRGDDEAGLLLVRTEPVALQESGHFWWRRWGEPREWFWLWTVIDGKFSDTLGPDDLADGQLLEFASGFFELYGETFRLEWVSEAEAERLRDTQFGYSV